MSARTPARPEEESPFEHAAFELLYRQVLGDVADRRLDERHRKAAARAVAFLLGEQLITERIATDVLAAIHTSLDLAAVVRTLLLGLRDALGDHEPITEWTCRAADCAVAQGHIGTFVSAARILVELRDYDGVVPTRWRLSLLRAIDDATLTKQVRQFAQAYAKRFPAQSWSWIRKARVRSLAASRCGSR